MQPEPRGLSPSAWLVILGSLAALGFFGYRAYYDGTLARLFGGTPPAVDATPAPPHPLAAGDAGVFPPPALDAGEIADADADAMAAPVRDAAIARPTQVPAAPSALTADELRFGRVEARITDSYITVTATQGLLVIALGPGGPAQVFIDDRDIGAAPLSLALEAGQHEISFRRGDESSFRFLNIRARHTHTVATP